MASRRRGRNQQSEAAQNPNGSNSRAVAEQYQGAGKSFKAKYLGSKDISDYRSSTEAKDAIHYLRKKGSSKTKMMITLHLKGLAVRDEKAKSVLIKVPIERVKFVCHDTKDATVFAVIIQVEPSPETDGNAYKLFCFQAEQTVAASFVRSTNELFQLLFRIMKAKRKMREEEKRLREAAEKAEAEPDDTPVTLGFGIPAPPPSYKTAIAKQNSGTFVTPSGAQPVVLPALEPPPVPKPRTKLPTAQSVAKASPVPKQGRPRPAIQELPTYEAVLDTPPPSRAATVAPSGAVAVGEGTTPWVQQQPQQLEEEHVYDVPTSPPKEATGVDRRQAVWEEWKTLDSELKDLAKELGMENDASASANTTAMSGASSQMNTSATTSEIPFETSFPSEDPFADDFFQESFGSPGRFEAQQSANASINQSFNSFSAFDNSSFDSAWGPPTTTSQQAAGTPTLTEASLTSDPFSPNTQQQQKTVSPTSPKPPTVDPFSPSAGTQQNTAPTASKVQASDPFAAQTQQAVPPSSPPPETSDPFAAFTSPQQDVPSPSPKVETGDLFASLPSPPQVPSSPSNDPFASATSAPEPTTKSPPNTQTSDPFLSMASTQQTTDATSPKTPTNDPFSSMTSVPQPTSNSTTDPFTSSSGASAQPPASPASTSEGAMSDPFSSIGSGQIEWPSTQTKAETQVDNTQTSTTDAFANFDSQGFSDTQQPTSPANVVLPKPIAQQTVAPPKAAVVPSGDTSISRSRPRKKSSTSNVVSISSEMFIGAASNKPKQQQPTVSLGNEPFSAQPVKQVAPPSKPPTVQEEGPNFFDLGNGNSAPSSQDFFGMEEASQQQQQQQQQQKPPPTQQQQQQHQKPQQSQPASTVSKDDFFGIDQAPAPTAVATSNADPFFSTPTKPTVPTSSSTNDPFSSGGQQQTFATDFSFPNTQQSLQPQQPTKSSLPSSEPLFSIGEAPKPPNNDPFGASMQPLIPTTSGSSDQKVQEEKTTDWASALKEAASSTSETGWSTNLQETVPPTQHGQTSGTETDSASGWSSSLQKMAPRSGFEAMANVSSGSLSPVVAQGGLIQPPPARGSSTPNLSHSPISRSRPHAAAPLPQRDFSDSGLAQLAPLQNPNPLNPQLQQGFQNSGSFAANFGTPAGPTPQPLNAQGFPPQTSPAPGSFPTNWQQQPNQPSGGFYPQTNGPTQMMNGPHQTQNMIPNQFPQGNPQVMAPGGPQMMPPPGQYPQMMPTQHPGARAPQTQVMPGQQQFPNQMQSGPGGFPQQVPGMPPQALPPGQQMFASPGGMPNATPQMMGQPQPGYFPPGSNMASPPGPPGSSNLSSGGFTSPPYAVAFSTPQSSGGTPGAPGGNFTSPPRPFGTPGTMLTNDSTGADPFAKLLPLVLSPSKDKLPPGGKKEERKEDKNNTAAAMKVSSLSGAEADNLLGSLDKPAPPKDSSKSAGFDDAFSPTGNNAGTKPEDPWIDF